MKKWECKIVDLRNLRRQDLFGGPKSGEIEEYLNRLGAEGWEMANLDFHEIEARGSFMGLAKGEINRDAG
jgi:hypothetical protein